MFRNGFVSEKNLYLEVTGGKTFFCDEPGLIITIPEGEVFHSKHNNLADCPDSLVNALQLHLMGVAIIVKLLQKESFLL